MSEKITINQGNIQGILNAPYSKSITHRALILAGFSKVGTEIKNMSTGFDVLATKNAMEQMGSELLVYAPLGKKQLIARLLPDTEASAGDTMDLFLDVSKMHFFDKETELVIR